MTSPFKVAGRPTSTLVSWAATWPNSMAVASLATVAVREAVKPVPGPGIPPSGRGQRLAKTTSKARFVSHRDHQNWPKLL